MSGLRENQKTLRAIHTLMSEIDMSDVTVFFVLSYPRSDMGKGTFVAQALNVVSESDAIKFDGLLNTNANGRHTEKGHDDFGIYERFNPTRSFSDEHYLLGGEIYRDFILTYGENENLQITPHLSAYVEYRLMKMWQDIGKPKNLFVEIGGVLTDNEVAPLFVPILKHFLENKNGKIILLTELFHNNEYIKTKTIQDGVKMLLGYALKPWLILAREPQGIQSSGICERIEFERIIISKLVHNLNCKDIRVISIPYFKNLSDYTPYIQKRFLPLLQQSNKKTVFLATKNKSKIKDLTLYLGDDYDLKTPFDFPEIDLEVVEGIDSISENAFAKARAYAVMTNLLCIADDTGFFIEQLNGEPGVAIRRWGGELSESATQETFWNYLQKKTAPLSHIDCYFKQCFAIVSPNGHCEFVYTKNSGTLNKEKLSLPYNNTNYPLGAAFEAKNRKMTWDEMTDEQKKEFDSDLISDLHSALEHF